jgi:hypothetical protein
MSVESRPRDQAFWGIVVSNVVTLAAALWQDWSVLELMWPFWAQSLIIGWYARQRILKLVEFSTAGFRINDRRVDPTHDTRRSTANFFALHYGGFHLGYLIFLIVMSTTADEAGCIAVTNESTGAVALIQVGLVHPFDFVIYAALAAGFWHSHRASHREHVAADLERVPNIGTLMAMPYARIVPMHLTIVFAFALGAGAIWLFVLLKIAADVVMHKVEHRVLQAPVRRRTEREKLKSPSRTFR